MNFEPDYRHIADVMKNERPARLPLYEHIVNTGTIEAVLDIQIEGLLGGATSDLAEYFQQYCRFFKEMTYDVVSFEAGTCQALPGNGAIRGGKAGPIQSRADFEAYPWDEVPGIFQRTAAARFDALIAALPPGMQIVGGVANGAFELSEDLVGLEFLPFMQIDDPPLYADLYNRIGDLQVELWTWFLDKYADHMVACRFGDDLGFKASLLTNPKTVRQQILPQYRRIIDLIHAHGKPFLWHSCGCVFEVMEDVIEIGIDAKHSNEDVIAPFDCWIDDYGERIGLLGGFDMDFLCTATPGEVEARVVEDGTRFRQKARGYALGSGNSIPEYVPVENYLAMVRGAQKIRELESSS